MEKKKINSRNIKFNDMENIAQSNDYNSTIKSELITEENSKTIVENVKFVDKPLPLQENIQNKKRQRTNDEVMILKKRKEEEEYNQEVHDQRYKRLMHLLNRSKFYSKYILDKIQKDEDKNKKLRKKVKHKANSPSKNIQSESNKRIKDTQNYDILDYVSTNSNNKKIITKNKLNLSNEEIENELIDSDCDSNTEIINTPVHTITVSKYFNGELHDYQKEGFHWLKVLYENGINGILADEMGLGKTIQVIALLCHLIEKQQSGPYLIIAPLSTIPNWMLEFERFAPKLPVFVYHGKSDQRLQIQKKIQQKHYITNTYKTQPIVLTTYEVPLTETNFFCTQHWRYIIIDEGQRIKNPQCQLVKVLKKFKSMNRLLLTGTPLQNNLEELWSLLNFLLPEIFNDLAIFESWLNVNDFQYDEGTKNFLKQEEEKHVLFSLREILKPFMLRREKSDVCLQIPPKKEIIVYAPITELQYDLYTAVLKYNIQTITKIVEPEIVMNEDGSRPKRKCVLNKQKEIYSKAENTYNTISEESNDSICDDWKNISPGDQRTLAEWKNYTNVTERNLDYLIRIPLRNRLAMYKKIINHPYLVHCPLNSVGLPKIDEDLIKSSGKLLVVDAMLAKLKSQGHKVILFSTMTQILDMIEDYLSLRNYEYVRLDGQTPLEKRSENIKNFNENPNIFLFLISTRAGGVGLNLASADTVIIYDSDWNPQADIQAMARCHRIGQTRPVVIYRLCTKGTIDETIIKRAEAKRILEKMVISKEVRSLNVNSKDTLLKLKELIEKKEFQIVRSEKEVFTEAELNKLLDRSDISETT